MRWDGGSGLRLQGGGGAGGEALAAWQQAVLVVSDILQDEEVVTQEVVEDELEVGGSKERKWRTGGPRASCSFRARASGGSAHRTRELAERLGSQNLCLRNLGVWGPVSRLQWSHWRPFAWKSRL